MTGVIIASDRPERRGLKKRWLALALLPATLIGAAAIAVALVVAVLPALTTFEYLAIDGNAPGASDGDLAVLREVRARNIGVGDVVAVDLGGGLALYEVGALSEGGAATLIDGEGLEAGTRAVTFIDYRLSETLTDAGAAYAFVNRGWGWGAVGGAAGGAWLLTLLLLFVLRRRGSDGAEAAVPIAAEVDAELSAAEVAAVPIAPEVAAVPSATLDAVVEAAAVSEGAAVALVQAEQHGAPAVGAASKPPLALPLALPVTRRGAGDPLMTLVRHVAREAPPHGTGRPSNLRRLREVGGDHASWIALGGAAAAVAVATFMIATEQRKQHVPSQKPPKKKRRGAGRLW